jgi:hypothetical protein
MEHTSGFIAFRPENSSLEDKKTVTQEGKGHESGGKGSPFVKKGPSGRGRPFTKGFCRDRDFTRGGVDSLQGEGVSSYGPERDVQVGDAREKGHEVPRFEMGVLEKRYHQFFPPFSELELIELRGRERCKHFHQEGRPSGEGNGRKTVHRNPEVE